MQIRLWVINLNRQILLDRRSEQKADDEESDEAPTEVTVESVTSSGNSSRYIIVRSSAAGKGLK